MSDVPGLKTAFHVHGTAETIANTGMFRVFRVFRVYAPVRVYRASMFLFSRAHIHLTRVHARVHMEHPEHSSNDKAFHCSGYPERQKRTRNIPMSKNLRNEMPSVAGWIDELREVFGKATIDASIRAGLSGQKTFHAKENDIEIGTRFVPDQEKTVRLDQMVLDKQPRQTSRGGRK